MPHRRLFFSLPMLMTWARLAAIPLLLAVYSLPLPVASCNLIAAVLFVLFAATDWADGYLARRMNLTSAFGAFLDPVADKFLVCASLLLLVELERVGATVAFIIIGREIAISALREWMARIGATHSVAVHMLGKFKTAAQMLAIPLLLFDGRLLGIATAAPGRVLIWVATALTVWSMLYYLRRAWPQIRSHSR